MADLKKQIVRHLKAGVEEGPRPDGSHPVAVAYLEEKYASCLRVRGKRLCREILDAKQPSAKATRELACFLAESLLAGNMLARITPSVALRPFAALLPSEPTATNIRKAKGDLREVLARLREDESAAKLLSPSNLVRLTSEMLRHDDRNKNFNACQRLMELREDVLLDGRGPGRSADKTLAKEDAAACAKLFLKEKGTTLKARAYYGVTSVQDHASWWEGVFATPILSQAERLTSCSLYIAAATFVSNLSSDCTRDLPMGLVESYLAEQGDQPQRASDDDLLQLVASMGDDKYKRVVVPLAIDSGTGGGLFLMGREHLAYHCLPSQQDEIPLVGACPAIIDYGLGMPARPTRNGAALHGCRVKLPTCDVAHQGLGAEDWREPLEGLKKLYAMRTRQGKNRAMRELSFWNSYHAGNGSQAHAPADCPEPFRAYFEPLAVPKRGLRLEEFPPDEARPVCAIVPNCLVAYLHDAQGEKLDGTIYTAQDVVRGAAPLPRDEVFEAMAHHYRDGKAFADFLPCVIYSNRSQTRWLEILRDALLLDDFMLYYLNYLIQVRVITKPEAGKALEWLANGEIDEQSDLRIGELSRRFVEQLAKRGRAKS